MNPLARAVGLVLLMIGGFWFFMGIGVIEDSVLSNNPIGTALGALILVAGVVVLWRAYLSGKKAEQSGDEDPPQPDGIST